MQPAVKQLLVDINNAFTKQYGRPIWSYELIEKEVETFISGSSKWFMSLRQPNPKFDPQQPVSDANPKEIGITDNDFQRVKKKVGDIDTQIDRRLEPQIEEFIHKNIGANIGSATLLGTKKGSDQWLALWQIHEPPITLQVDLEFSDYTTDERGFEIPTEWAQVSHGSAWEDLEAGMKGVFRQWLYRSLAKVAPTDKYIAKITGAGKNKGMKLFGGDDGKEPVVDLNNPPPPFHDANFSFAVASVGGGGVRAKYRQPTPQENVPFEINGVPVMVPLSPAESEYVKDMSQQFEQFFGVPAKGNETKMMAGFVGTVELMKQYLDENQLQIAVDEFIKINFGKGGQMIEADDPTEDFKIKIVAIDYLLDHTGMKNLRKQVLQMAKEYEANYTAKQGPAAESLNEAEVKAQLRKGMPHLRDLKAPDFLDLLDEIHDGNGRFKLENIPLNVKIDGFGGRFGKNADGKPFMGTSRTEPRYQAGFLDYHQKKGTTDPEILGRAKIFDDLFHEMMKAVDLVDSKLGPDFLVNKQITCEVLFLPFASETPEGKLKFVGIHYDKLPAGIELALVPFRVVDATTGDDLPESTDVIKQLLSVGSSGSVMFIDNSLTQKEGLDVTEIINPLDNLEELKQIVSDTAGKRDRASQQLKREVEEKLQPIKLALEKAIGEDPNIIGKDLLGQDYEGIVINSRLGPIKITSQEQKQVIADKNAAKAAAHAEQPRESSNKTAVVAIGSFVGHKGHEQLWKYTVDKAAQVGGDPYLFIGSAEGKDDPIPPSVKVQTWHKMYPEYAKNISTVQSGGSLLQKIKHELINPLPGKPPRYDNVIIMVGKDRESMANQMAVALKKAVNKFQGYEHVEVTPDVTERDAEQGGTGVSFSSLRNALKTGTPEQQYAAWTQGFDEAKLGKSWILHLMDITRKGMGIPAPVVEQRLFNSLIRPINEGTSIESTMRAIINDIGEPVTNVYDTMKFQAKKYMENHGELGRGFRMVAAGVGGRWVQNMYFGRLQNELYDLCRYNTRRTVDLQDFLRGVETKGELDSKRSFGSIANGLPEILAKVGQHLNAPQLIKNAQRWIQNKAEYEQYIAKLEAEADDDYDEPVAVKSPKSNVAGQQNVQVDQIVNSVLSKLPSKIQGDIRNAIARAPNKLQALQAELQKRGVKAPMAEDDVNELDVSKTLNFATKAHKGQQYGEKPYITHPRSVAATGKKFFGAAFTPDAIKVALLHDVVEDTPYKLNQLAKMGYSPEVVEAVQLLTKNKALSYADNIKAIIASGNKLAMMVKYADNYQNFTGDKSSWDPARVAHSQKKYLASLDMLGDKLGVTKHLSQPEEQGVAEGSRDDDEYGPKAREEWLKQQAYEKEYNKKKPSTPVKPANKSKEQGVAEGPQDDPEDYRAHLIKTLPQMMNFLAKSVNGWKPTKEQYLAAIDTGYEVMKHTGNVQQAGKAISDELNTLHRISQSKSGMMEERTSAAVRMQRAADRQRAKSDASLRRTPSSIPKPEPKKDEKVAERRAVEPDPTGYAKDLLTSPKNALVVDTPGDLDWYKLGQHYPTLGSDDPHEYGQSDSDMVIVPYSEKELAGLKQKLDRLKMRYKDIGGSDTQPEIHDRVEEKIKGADGKACWKGYRYNGTENGKDKCVPVSEDVQDIMDLLINKIITNEAISYNRK